MRRLAVELYQRSPSLGDDGADAATLYWFAKLFTLEILFPTVLTFEILLATTSISEVASFKSFAAVTTFEISDATAVTLDMLFATVLISLYPELVVNESPIEPKSVPWATFPATTFISFSCEVFNAPAPISLIVPESLTYNFLAVKSKATSPSTILLVVGVDVPRFSFIVALV